MAEPFLGEIKMVGFNFAPRGWAFCDNQLLPISSNSALFSLLGTTFGGDGRSTFGLPDLRGRVAKHVGTGPGLASVRWGQKGGSESINVLVNNMPSHNHTLHAEDVAGVTNMPANNMLSQSTANNMYDPKGRGTIVNMEPTSIGNTGGGQSINHVPPYLGIYHCIALVGLYPSRS